MSSMNPPVLDHEANLENHRPTTSTCRTRACRACRRPQGASQERTHHIATVIGIPQCEDSNSSILVVLECTFSYTTVQVVLECSESYAKVRVILQCALPPVVGILECENPHDTFVSLLKRADTHASLRCSQRLRTNPRETADSDTHRTPPPKECRLRNRCPRAALGRAEGCGDSSLCDKSHGE